MPAIWNVSNNYNVNNNNKRVSSKLTFEVGERFSGRIVGKGEGKEVTIKLSDGWQFNAEIEGDIDLLDKGNVKFEVEGYENGKLKLKLVAGNNEPTKEEGLNNLLNKDGIGKKDELLLKQMVKFNIPLTKENINELKGLIQFNEKINSSEEEIFKFIKNYLQSKNISGESVKGQEIVKTLNDFMKEFKSLDENDILFFKENNIEFTEEGIKTYNKFFKEGKGTVNEFLNELKAQLSGDENKTINDSKREVEPLKNESMAKENINKSDIEKEISPDKESALNKDKLVFNNTNAKAYEGKEKVSVLDVLKTIAQEETPQIKDEINNIIKTKGTSFTKDELGKIANVLKELGNDGIAKEFKTLFSNNKEVTKESFEITLGKIIGKEVTLTEKEFTQLKNLIEAQIEKLPKEASDGLTSKAELNGEELKKVINEVGDKIQTSSKEIVKENIKENINNLKDVVKEMISQSKLEGEAGEKIFNLLKNNLNSFKMMNSINNEYYYLDMPIKREESEYPCKLIIKDNRKDGKKIDRNNVKMVVSIQTINLGTIDGYLTFKNNNLDVELKCLKEVSRGIILGKEKLENNLKELGFSVNIRVSEKIEEVSLVNCREFFGEKHKSMLDKRV
ncbi:MAG: flagellar hook-length control protein FliK [Clostridium sp.]